MLTFIFLLFAWILVVFVALYASYLMAKLTLRLAAAAVIFSRISFSMFFAFAFSQSCSPIIKNQPFWNFSIWFVIVLGVVLILSLLPRVNYALKFLSTAFVSCLIAKFLVMVLIGSILPIFGINISYNLFIDTIIMAACILFSCGTLLEEIKDRTTEQAEKSLPLPLNIFQKVLAAVFYGLGIWFFISSFSGITLSLPVQWILLICSTVAGFFFDFFVSGYIAKQTPPVTENEVLPPNENNV